MIDSNELVSNDPHFNSNFANESQEIFFERKSLVSNRIIVIAPLLSKTCFERKRIVLQQITDRSRNNRARFRTERALILTRLVS